MLKSINIKSAQLPDMESGSYQSLDVDPLQN